MELRDSITKENLLRAFAGESQARNRYTFAADVCCQNKMQALEQVFLYTAGQEKEHAEIYYNHLVKGGCENITITANYPIDLSQQPLKLLELAREHEMDEFDDIYPAFAQKAEEEGFMEIARSPPSRRSTRTGSTASPNICGRTSSISATWTPAGSASTAAMCCMGPRRPPSARSATTTRGTLSAWSCPPTRDNGLRRLGIQPPLCHKNVILPTCGNMRGLV